MVVRVIVRLKPAVPDPESADKLAKTRDLGIVGITSIRQGKVFLLEFQTNDAQKALSLAKEAAEKLLANNQIEEFEVDPNIQRV